MRFIEPHAHMVSRTTDDYADMATAGCVALCEPAFGQASTVVVQMVFVIIFGNSPRSAATRSSMASSISLALYQSQGVGGHGTGGGCVIDSEFMECPNVLGIGEIGLNKNSRNEIKVLQQHVDLAAAHDQLILVHTPHLEDKYKGTRLILDVLKYDSRINPERVMIDHVEEYLAWCWTLDIGAE